jgi:amino acid transporter
MNFERTIKVKDLVFMSIIAMVGLRWIALSAGEAGWSSIFLWLAAIVAFFIPQALVVSELNRVKPVTGGLYVWARDALGDFNGFISGWCYWTNNFVYYPSLLGFVAPTLAFLIGRSDLASNRWFVMGTILLLLWIAVAVNLVGIKPTKRMENAGGISTLAVFISIMVLGIIFISANGIQNKFTPDFLLPHTTGAIATWSALCFALSGFELLSTFGDEIKNARKTVFKSIVISAVCIALIYLLGTIFILGSMPISDIAVDIGIQETLYRLSEKVGAPWIGTFCFVLLIVGGMAGVGAWLAGTSRVSYKIGINRRLPEVFSRIHPRWKTPHWSILFQGIIASILTVVAYLWTKPSERVIMGGETMQTMVTSSAYMILVEMTAIIYLIPFVYLFLSFLVIKLKEKSPERGYIPWGKAGVWLFGLLGLISSMIAVAMPFVDVLKDGLGGNTAILIGGTALFLGLGMITYKLTPGEE